MNFILVFAGDGERDRDDDDDLDTDSSVSNSHVTLLKLMGHMIWIKKNS